MCSLPPYPKGANYVVSGRPSARPGDVVRSAHLVYSCPSDKRLVGDKDILCVDNVWSGEIPKCEDAVGRPGLARAKENDSSNEGGGTAFIKETSATTSLGPLSTTETNEQDTVPNRRIKEKNKEDEGTALAEDTSITISLKSSPESVTNIIEQAEIMLSLVTEEGNSTKVDEETTSKDGSTMDLIPLGPSSSGNNNTLQDMKCTRDGHIGVCRAISECDSVKSELTMNEQPQLCSQPLVCCMDDVLTLDAPPVATPVPTELQTTTDYTPPEYDYESNDKVSPEGCEQIPPRLTSRRTGRKAWDKCIEYQENYVYVCKKGVALGENNIRVNYCGHNTDGMDDTGRRSKSGEFPHMVLLGYQMTIAGEVTDDVNWYCGGSIISEKFVLTTAQCATASGYGPVAFIRTSMSKRSDPLDPERLYKVAKVIPHPDYNGLASYNDIGLLETEKQMVLDRLAVPACLPVGNAYDDSVAVAIGFGSTTYEGKVSDSLQKVVLSKFSHDECAKQYPRNRHLPKGIIDNVQICYGDKFVSKDTCKGDAGGPLNIHNKDVHCMYTVIGMVSFGRMCGIIGVPGVYTGVAVYTSWIESHVWPD